MSVPDVGRSLRRARARLGLRIEDVSARTGLDEVELEALESGSVGRLPDRVGILQTLRRYADALGLPGDSYVLAVVDHWPTVVTVPPATYGDAPTSATPAASPAGTGETVAVPVVAAAAVRTPTSVPGTGQGVGETFVGGTSPPPGGVYVASSQTGVHNFTSPLVIADTGVTPAVPSTRRRRSGRIIFLRVLIGLVCLLVALGLAGLAANQWRPQWLRTLGLPHRSIPAAAHTAVTTPHPATRGATPAQFALASTSSNGATFNVRAPTFTVAIVPAGTASWVQATDAQHVSPIFSQTVPAGQTQTFTATQSLTVQVGSRSARVFVTIDHKVVGFYFPTSAPFTMTFNSVG
ncbi:MAG TPA: RodZ domain-containing protein [Acidimicrobiales bacterium]|nr:RodZ domain-containing protein [Acidimicrobiales bacterium]